MKWFGIVMGSVAAFATACAEEGVRLSELGPMSLVVIPDGSFQGRIMVFLGSEGTECPTINAEATATLDGQPLRLSSAGGSYEDSLTGETNCDSISFSGGGELPRLPLGTETSTIVLKDPSANWTAEIDGLRAGDITIIGTVATDAQVTLHWPTASAVNAPWDPQVTFYDQSGQVFAIWTCNTATPGTCDGGYADKAAFTPIAGTRDWAFPIRWSTASGAKTSSEPVTGRLTIGGNRPGTAPDGSTVVRRCDGPSSCRVRLESVATYPATLF